MEANRMQSIHHLQQAGSKESINLMKADYLKSEQV